MKGFERQDSSVLGFAVSCLFYRALSLREFEQWLTALYEEGADLPPFCVDLLGFNRPLVDIYEVIGFIPDWPFKEKEKLALVGIAFERGTPPMNPPISREKALQKLANAPHVLERFRSLFPFVEL